MFFSFHWMYSRMRFDMECMAGQHTDCPVPVMLLGWANFIKALMAATLLSALMRHSDGANFVVIVLVSNGYIHVTTRATSIRHRPGEQRKV